MGKAKICSIGVSVPAYKVSQKSYLNYFLKSPAFLPENERLIKTICYKSGINERYSVLADFSEEDVEKSFYQDSELKSPGISKRMDVFEDKALNLAIEAVKDCLQKSPENINDKISHLISFSCTGMYAPGIDMGIIEAFDLPKDIERTCINFMGCYAAIVALKNAYHIVRSNPGSVVLLVGVELCSIHHTLSADPEQMVANAIFGDGAAAVLVTGENVTINNSYSLELSNFYALFSPGGKKDMTWKIGDKVFELFLSSYVPKLLDKELLPLTEKLLENANLKKEEIHYYAIHPGGMAILKACENALRIDPKENHYSYKVLHEYGNMSSVTVLFVLNELMKNLKDSDLGKNVLSFAFGPGLTMESMLLKVGS
jgi:alpha-pyrone synthase